MIEARNLTKRYGKKVAVDDVSFSIKPGRVTGFLGPNGAGKSTTMRLIMGMDKPTSGSVTVGGESFVKSKAPLTRVGSLLDAKGVHPSRTAYSHLHSIAVTHGIPSSRIDEVLAMTGLTEVAKKRIGGFSLGMGQRLGIAAALLGDPEILLFDEPVNGLDPEGVVWVRQLSKELAANGKTVLVSSHLMSEMALTADDVIVIGKGKILASGAINDIIGQNTKTETVFVVSPQLDELIRSLGSTIAVDRKESNVAFISNLDAATIGRRALESGIELHQLTTKRVSLEDAFLQLTEQAVEFKTGSKGETL
ncbi:ABC transporter ATP-binding protein [Boudabousia marimammalium]|uniref:Multidrug ABC transporter ATP-binding protein n=1 Tax=Boudabousia marimammalium TaxID=156892 RepID=A0A1Q5PRQ3_9ACTO|nr:ABC transporter ATP-binding protein [Boudabousia marimammalium]OKL50268.1 multidrug ABC transporter ATP-binding protein [Boudabousia marimammalium]